MKFLDNEFFNTLLLEAEASPRKRAHYNMHQNYDEPVQRLYIGLKSGTYIRPHCHRDKDAWELIMLVKGAVDILIFNINGCIEKRFKMSSTTGNQAVQLEPDTWHMVIPVSTSSVIFEVKEGPFSPKKLCDFAVWAPEEGASDVDTFLEWACSASLGEKYKV